MTEHVHKWYINRYGETKCRCGEELPNHEAEFRLNATERLSANDAKHISDFIRHKPLRFAHKKALRAYADILEGKDG